MFPSEKKNRYFQFQNNKSQYLPCSAPKHVKTAEKKGVTDIQSKGQRDERMDGQMGRPS